MNQVILQLAPLVVMLMLSFSLAVIAYLSIKSTTYTLATVAYSYLISF